MKKLLAMLSAKGKSKEQLKAELRQMLLDKDLLDENGELKLKLDPSLQKKK